MIERGTEAPEATRPAGAAVVVAGLPMQPFRRIDVSPLTGACGAEVEGVDLSRPLDPETLAEVMVAFEQFLVLVFRRQPLTPEQHKSFTRYFGEITCLPQAPIYPGHPDMQEVRREAHEPASVVPFANFHTDSLFLPRPPLGIVMQALEVPRFGGDTAFANMYSVYESLSERMKAFAETLRVHYSGKDLWARNASRDPDKRLRLREDHDFSQDQLECFHPAVRLHPRTGRKALFVTRAYFKGFVGFSEDESQALLAYFTGLPYRLVHHCRVRWEAGTVIVWDNRFTQHCGVHDYENERRHLIRTTIEGEAPLG
jgi:alpha-ketoglutarate-dependent taurine dioxygenase